MNQNVQPHSSAWVTFTYASFSASAFMVAIGVYFLPLDLWEKGYLSMGIVMLVQSCVTLTKTVRDMHESGKLVNRPVLWGTLDLGDSSQLGPFTITADAKFFYLCLSFLVLALLMARSLRRRRSGRVLIGVRDNGRAVQAFGVNLARSRLAALWCSACSTAL